MEESEPVIISRKPGRPRKDEENLNPDEKTLKRREFQRQYYKEYRKKKKPENAEETRGRKIKYPELLEENKDKAVYKKLYHQIYYKEHKPERTPDVKIGRPLKYKNMYDELGPELYEKWKYRKYYIKVKERRLKNRGEEQLCD